MVSVVIATYNGEKFILKQLESVVNQTVMPDEIIVNDDHSSDSTVDLIKNYAKEKNLEKLIHIFINEKNLGFAGNFTKAVDKAKGDIIFLCDQDDEWKADKIEKMKAVFDNDESVLSLCSEFDIIDAESNKISDKKTSGKCKKISMKSFLRYPNFHGMTMAFRRDIWADVKSTFAKGFTFHDWSINYCSAKRNGLYFLDIVTSYYRRYDANISGLMKYQESDVLSKRINMLTLICNNMIAAENPELNSKIKYEKKRLTLLENRKIIPLFFYNLVNLRHIAVKPALGDIYALLSR